MPCRPQKPKKKAFDIQRPVCYNVFNAGEIVAASQVDRGPDQNLIPAANGFHGSPKSESNQLPTDSYNVLSKRELINLLRRKPSCFDDVDLLCLTSSITRRLETLRARAREGNWVEEASEFARWLLSSGLMKLLEGKGRAAVQKLANDTLYDCDCFWRNQGQGPWVAKSELETVNAKLDNLAGLVARLSPPVTETATADQVLPALHVIQGGVS
jgi:hypothetical protein